MEAFWEAYKKIKLLEAKVKRREGKYLKYFDEKLALEVQVDKAEETMG